MSFSMPNMSDLRVQSLGLRERKEALNRELGRMAGDTVRFLNAMAMIVSHGGTEIRFSFGVMSFRIHMGEKGKFVADYDLREHDEETRRYMDELELDVRMTSYLYILSHAAEIAAACTEQVAARDRRLEEGVTLVRSLIGETEEVLQAASETLWARSRRDGRPSGGTR